MTDFRGYLCWDPPLPTGLSTPRRWLPHRPFSSLRILRWDTQGTDSGPVTCPDGRHSRREHRADDFLSRKPDTGTLLMPSSAIQGPENRILSAGSERYPSVRASIGVTTWRNPGPASRPS